MDLFDDVVALDKQHPIYQMMKQEQYSAERAVLNSWAHGFEDRDGKFIKEFQMSFESCLWELYLFAYLKEIDAEVDFSFDAPDFVSNLKQPLTIEATISLPAMGGQPAHGYNFNALPEDFNRFNSEAAIRISNSFTTKVRKYRDRYSQLDHVKGKPYVIAIASFDRPFAHMAANRPVISALYGLYHDEEATIASGSEHMVSYNVDGAVKNENTDIDLGFFCSEEYSDVSAVVFSSLATWGKVRALADNRDAPSVYVTFHPNPGSIHPIVHTTPKRDYNEHLLDGLCVFHNPFANNPISPETFAHERIAQVFVRPDGELDFIAPDDFLLLRYVQSLRFV